MARGLGSFAIARTHLAGRRRVWSASVTMVAVLAASLVSMMAVADAAPAASPTGYTAIRPCRAVDTRLAGGALAAGAERGFAITGASGFAGQGGKAAGCGIPVGAAAVQASITAVSPTTGGYAQAWPDGAPMPSGAFVRYTAGQNITNTGSLSLAATGATQLRIKSSGASTHYVVDILGYFAPASGDRYTPIAPCRVVDTRVAGGAIAGGGSRSFAVTGATGFDGQGGKATGCAIPAGITAVEASVTAVSPTAAGFTRAWPSDGPVPVGTFLNFVSGQNITNTGSLTLATSGAQQLSLYTSAKSQYVIDIQGYYAPNGVAQYVPVTTCRIADTRNVGPMKPGSQRAFVATGTAGFGDQGGKLGGCGIPVGAVAIESSVTALHPSANGYARTWPDGDPAPTATFLNYAEDEAITNTGALSLAATGARQLRLSNNGGHAQYLIDVHGYFTSAEVPDAPTGVTAVRGNLQVELSWTTPASDGGAPITDYVITPSIGGAPQAEIASAGPGTSKTITGLTNGTEYTFTVVAVNAIGSSASSAASDPVTPATLPGAPTSVLATSGDSTAIVTWDAPATDGGTGIVGYTVTTFSGGAQLTSQYVPSTNTTRQIDGLTNGTPYTFTVAAVNGVGVSPASDASNEVTPLSSATVAGAPTNVTGTDGDDAKTTLTWAPPASDGGSAITGYSITPYIGAAAQPVIDAPGTATSKVITGLTNGTAYTFKVAAVNGLGTGAMSDASAPITPARVPTAPDAPTGVAAAGGDGQATVTWTPPASDGGSAIDSYLVVPYIDATAQTPIVVPGTDTSKVVTGLANGTTYTFRVLAGNAQGYGPQSAPSNPVTPATSTFVPGAPTDVTASAGDGMASVAWTAPADDGGATITGYWVIATAADVQQWTFHSGPDTSMDLTGLTNGTSYSFSARAVNAMGFGPASAESDLVTPTAPASVPGAPTAVLASPGDASATVSWTAPANNGGANVTGYVITPYVGPDAQGSFVSNGGAVLTKTVAPLSNDIAYTFTVAAKNAVGTGPESVRSGPVVPAGAKLVMQDKTVSVTDLKTPKGPNDVFDPPVISSVDVPVAYTAGGRSSPFGVCVNAATCPTGQTSPLIGRCTTATFNNDAVKVVSKPNSSFCSDLYTVTGAGVASKTFTAKRYDPMAIEIDGGLLIRYANTFTKIWESDVGNQVALYEPKVPSVNSAYYQRLPTDYFQIASVISNRAQVSATSQPGTQYQAVMANSAANPGTLGTVSDFRYMWSNRGSSGVERGVGNVWEPICSDPANYVPMGAIANYESFATVNGNPQFAEKPDASKTRCVRKDLTVVAGSGPEQWNDSGSGASCGLHSYALWDPLESTCRHASLSIL